MHVGLEQISFTGKLCRKWLCYDFIHLKYYENQSQIVFLTVGVRINRIWLNEYVVCYNGFMSGCAQYIAQG